MIKSPQFKKALLNNLEKLNNLNVSIDLQGATLSMPFVDYSRHEYLPKQKVESKFRNILTQKIF